MDQGIDKNLIRVLFIAHLYEILTGLYPNYPERALTRYLRVYKDLVVTEDILTEFKQLRDIINTPYTEYSSKVALFRALTSKFSTQWHQN